MGAYPDREWAYCDCDSMIFWIFVVCAALTFLDASRAGHFKGVDPTAPIAELAALWVPGAQIVYIGKANLGASGRRGLHKRLNEFRKYGVGVLVAHTGGRRTWQLVDHAQLIVGWRVTDDAEARPVERALIAVFYGALPCANMND